MINGPGKYTVKIATPEVNHRGAPPVRCMNALAGQISELDGVVICGRVVGVRGLMVEVAGPLHACRSARVSLSRRRASLFLARSWGFLVATQCSFPSRHSKVCGADAGRWSPRLPARFAPRPAGWGALSTRSASRLTARAPCCLGRRLPPGAFLARGKEEATSLAEGYRRLAEIVAASETER